jgi:hypothetical protein
MAEIKKQAYSRIEFADAYGISLSSVKNLIKAGDLVPVRSGAKILIPATEAERWFKSLSTERARPNPLPHLSR